MMNSTDNHKLDEIFSSVLGKISEVNNEKLDLIVENNSDLMMEIEFEIFNRKVNKMIHQKNSKLMEGKVSSTHTNKIFEQETFIPLLVKKVPNFTKRLELNNVIDKQNEKYNMEKVA